MRIAFYAPLKPLDHPIPSGDRAMARSFFSLLEELGHDVFVASRLRSYDRLGDSRRQQRMASLGARLAERLLAKWARDPAGRPGMWFTYHLYHKAPDWLGPRIARRLGIPYVVAEASIAPKQRHGRWAEGYLGAAEAVAAADRILAITQRDRQALLEARPDAEVVQLFPPFIDTSPFELDGFDRRAARAALASIWGLDADRPWLLAVGMMRDDAKRRSFELILETLKGLRDRRWQMLLVGDGPARPDLEALAASLGPERVAFMGRQSPGALADLYRAADLYFWPGVDEAYGMAIMEAQAAGLPVVAGKEGGIPEIVEHGETGLLIEPRRPRAFGEAITALIDAPEQRRVMGLAGAERMRSAYGRAVARQRLAGVVEQARLLHAAAGGHAL